MRLSAASVLGIATAAAGAVVLGDYPLSGSVAWPAALVIPLLIGAVMTVAAGEHRRALWIATGPLAAGSLVWGIRIASGWGLDPVPSLCWVAVALALVWPVGWGLWPRRYRASVDGHLRDLGHPGRAQVGDP